MEVMLRTDATSIWTHGLVALLSKHVAPGYGYITPAFVMTLVALMPAGPVFELGLAGLYCRVEPPNERKAPTPIWRVAVRLVSGLYERQLPV